MSEPMNDCIHANAEWQMVCERCGARWVPPGAAAAVAPSEPSEEAILAAHVKAFAEFCDDSDNPLNLGEILIGAMLKAAYAVDFRAAAPEWQQRCPVCDGAGLVSRPPGIAGDVTSWAAATTQPYPCRRCDGHGTISARGVPSRPNLPQEPGESLGRWALRYGRAAGFHADVMAIIQSLANALVVGAGVPSREDYDGALREIAQLEANVTDLRRSHEIADRENDRLAGRLARAEQVIHAARLYIDASDVDEAVAARRDLRQAVAAYDSGTGSET